MIIINKKKEIITDNYEHEYDIFFQIFCSMFLEQRKHVASNIEKLHDTSLDYLFTD